MHIIEDKSFFFKDEYVSGRDLIYTNNMNDKKIKRFIEINELTGKIVFKYSQNTMSLSEINKVLDDFDDKVNLLNRNFLIIIELNSEYRPFLDIEYICNIVSYLNENDKIEMFKNRNGALIKHKFDSFYSSDFKEYEDFFDKNIEDFDKNDMAMLEMKYGI